MDIPCREVAYDEKDRLLELLKHLNPDDLPPPGEDLLDEIWAEIRADKKIRCIVAETEGKLVGSCMLIIVPNLTRGTMPYGLIENVVTHADYRKKGIGREILKRALSPAWENNCYKVMLLTSRHDEATVRFCRNSGWESGVKTGFVAYRREYLRRRTSRKGEQSIPDAE